MQIDLDLGRSSVHAPELGVDGQQRRQPGWQEEAMALAVGRLQEIGFVVVMGTRSGPAGR